MARKYFSGRYYQKPGEQPKQTNEYQRSASSAEVVDWIEGQMRWSGIPGQSYGTVVFNGDPEPHHTVYMLVDPDDPTNPKAFQYGLVNHDRAEWPVWYEDDGGSSINLDSDYRPPDRPEADEGSGHKRDDEADVMNLEGNEGSEDGDGEDEDQTEEFDDPTEESGYETEDGSESENEKPGDDGPERENDEAENDQEDEMDSESDEHGEGESDSEDDSENENEEEKEMPRLQFFGKFRGPKGWRKRAESNTEAFVNRMSVRFGVLDNDAPTTATAEMKKLVEVIFTEKDDQRGSANLTIKLPSGMTIADFRTHKYQSNLLTIDLPTQ